MGNFFEKIKRFMYGRNGIDKFSVCLFLIYLLINGINSFVRYPVAHYIILCVSTLVLIFALYRIFSKNLYRRQYEEDKFETFLQRTDFSGKTTRTKAKFHRFGIRMKQIKTHRFRTCPECGEFLRLSKKKGKRNITCPICGRQFFVHIYF
jgi:hypothetical protein